MTKRSAVFAVLAKPQTQIAIWAIIFLIFVGICISIVFHIHQDHFLNKITKIEGDFSMIIFNVVFFVCLSFLFLGYPTKDLAIFMLNILIREKSKIHLREVIINADESDLVRLKSGERNSILAKVFILYPMLIFFYIFILISYVGQS